MNKFTLYFGLNDKDTKTQLINTVEAYKIACNLVMKSFEGATISEATGIYKHEDGTFVTESTLRIEILFAEEREIKSLVDILKKVFNQESVAVQREVVNSQLW